MDVLLLQFQAIMMSFAGPRIDDLDTAENFPCRSMLTGLLGNAKGWDEYADSDKLAALQNQISYAVRCDRPGKTLEDFQTVDVTQPDMQGAEFTRHGWTRGRPNHHNTLTRFRRFIADGRFVVAITLQQGDFTLDELEAAIRRPARPLYLGRKSFLPSLPIFFGRTNADFLVQALLDAPFNETERVVRVRWPVERPDGRIITIYEDRDWVNHIHVGERRMKEGYLEVPCQPT